MDILHQLGDLVLGSVPTMILFVLLVIAYDLLVGKPLAKTLRDRMARTSGAVQQAHAAISAAESETAAYEAKLRSARAEILAEREHRLQQWQEQREQALNQAKNTAQERLTVARQEIESASAAAREQIESATSELSEQIMRVLLPQPSAIQEVNR
jgi:F-type H+-transporting ATPase subunit b